MYIQPFAAGIVALGVVISLIGRPDAEAGEAFAALVPGEAFVSDGGVGDDSCGVDLSQGARAPFTLSYLDEESSWRLAPAFVLPGAVLEIRAEAPRPLDATADAGVLTRVAGDLWQWTAPATPGSSCLLFSDGATGERAAIRAFTLVPWDGAPTLNGYRIGRYGPEPADGNPLWKRPRGFVEITPDNENLRISPHFRLGEFLCKQPGTYPKYVTLRTRLLTKLELLVEELRARGVPVRGLHVMSGYRTPDYNAAIGNTTTRSRHLYGDAADVFVDEDGDARMDDLDGDGSVTVADARILYRLSEERFEGPRLVGGLGLYGPAPHRGPFVHVDARGYRARW